MSPPPFEVFAEVPHALAQYWALFDAAGTEYGLTSALLAAICWRETKAGTDRRNLDVLGPAGRGDCGNGLGLMQVDKRYHAEWAALVDENGTPLWQLPRENIRKGASILHAYSLLFPREIGLAVISYNRGPGNVRHALRGLSGKASPLERLQLADRGSAHSNYGADVLQLQHQFNLLRR